MSSPSPTPAGPAPAQLRRGVLSSWEVLAQSVANIAPTATPTVVIPLVFAYAAGGSWAAYLFALVAIALVAVLINQFARRSSSPGNLYTYVALGLGPTAAVVVGWALFIAYIGTASAVTGGFANYVEVLAHEAFGFDGTFGAWGLVGVIAVSVLGSWFVAWKDVRLSTRLMLGLELASVTLILVVVVATIARQGIDLDVLTLKGVDSTGLRYGLVLAIFSFVGFESATSLGTEAGKPLRTIPHAVLRSAIFVGALFIVASYAETVGFAAQGTALTDSTSPVQDLAHFAGLGGLSIPITIGAIISFFACTLASITAGARVLFQLGRHGLFHRSLGGAHDTNSTPHVAIAVSTVVAFVPAAVVILLGQLPFDLYGWVGTTATLSFIVAYIAVAVAAPVYLRRIGHLRAWHVVVAVAAVALQGYALYASVWPWPSGTPAQWPIVAFVALLAVGGGFGVVQLRRSAALRGELAADLAALEAEHAPEPVAPAVVDA